MKILLDLKQMLFITICILNYKQWTNNNLSITLAYTRMEPETFDYIVECIIGTI